MFLDLIIWLLEWQAILSVLDIENTLRSLTTLSSGSIGQIPINNYRPDYH